MNQVAIINAGLGAGTALISAGVGARYGWEMGAIVLGGLMLSLSVWIATRIRAA